VFSFHVHVFTIQTDHKHHKHHTKDDFPEPEEEATDLEAKSSAQIEADEATATYREAKSIVKGHGDHHKVRVFAPLFLFSLLFCSCPRSAHLLHHSSLHCPTITASPILLHAIWPCLCTNSVHSQWGSEEQVAPQQSGVGAAGPQQEGRQEVVRESSGRGRGGRRVPGVVHCPLCGGPSNAHDALQSALQC